MRTSDFAFDLRASVAPPNHLGVGSGWGVVQPALPTVCGVGDIFSPPYALRAFRMMLEFNIDGHRVIDDGNTKKGDCGLLYAGGTWRPDAIERRGTYHHRIDGRLISAHVTSTLVPLFGRAGFVLELRVRNRSGRAVKMTIEPRVEIGSPHHRPLDAWAYPAPGGPEQGRQVSDELWTTGKIDVRLLKQNTSLELPVGGEARAYVAIVASDAGAAVQAPRDLSAWMAETKNAWHRRLERASQCFPTLASDVPGLAEYYKRSLVSGLVCLWERDDFAANPYVSIGGLDGGGICSYLWDVGSYAADCLALLLGADIAPFANRLGQIDFRRFYQMTPAGTGEGVPYAYSPWSFVTLVWSLARQFGPSRELFDAACQVVLASEQSHEQRNGLLDFGKQHNLLEMRGAGWEHFTPSPNAERAWCFDRLTDLALALGQTPDPTWKSRAAEIRRAVVDQLWDADAGWFRCVHLDGHAEMVYSIQAFDVLPAGVCTPAMTDAMLSHLRDGAFLGPYGVSSISAEDERHYEVNDPDWSGSGAYSGEPPQLAQTLWEMGRAELAWDVLRRLLWMGRMLPYFPQEHYCDRPAVPAHKRANVVAGLTGAQAILFGMIGFEPRIDGTAWLRPGWTGRETVALKGLVFRGRRFDIELSNGRCEVSIDGRSKYSGAAQHTRLL